MDVAVRKHRKHNDGDADDCGVKRRDFKMQRQNTNLEIYQNSTSNRTMLRKSYEVCSFASRAILADVKNAIHNQTYYQAAVMHLNIARRKPTRYMNTARSPFNYEK